MIYTKIVGYPTPPDMPEGLTYLGEISTRFTSGTVTRLYYRDDKNPRADEKEFVAKVVASNTVNKSDVSTLT